MAAAAHSRIAGILTIAFGRVALCNRVATLD
jgi:hypothetical protein